ncbi:HCL205Wp [Eremothecium sinecaudum]|uniref:HCL205Wp n=1 Tax=Eremothecium sinecaudum TaxID=45286 RepID=A0A0X8HQ70_9SACH|nr:HCL205Wp [Eremothecium sinecaudum]AMD19946.1 HCL205Wp [Eremothecium sinecaudum]
MLRAEFTNLVACHEAKCVLPVNSSKSIIVVNSNNDFFVYTIDEKSNVRLLYQYEQPLGTSVDIQKLAYSVQLQTVFVKCEKSFLLLHASSLKQYDKIVDKRGSDRFWVFEKTDGDDMQMTLLVYSIKDTMKLRMLAWINKQFQSIQEVNLSSKSEVLKSVTLDVNGCIVVSSTAVYHWPFMQSYLLRIDKVQKPAWPKDLYDAVMELEASQTELSVQGKYIAEDTKSIRSSDNMSQISKKTNMSSFFFKKPIGRAFNDIRFTFKPSNLPHPVVLDGKTEMLLQLDVSDNGMHVITVIDNKKFYDRNKEFNKVQHFCSRMLIVYNSNSVKIVDYYHGFTYAEIFVNKGVKKVFVPSHLTLMLWTTDNTLEFYRLIVDRSAESLTVADDKPVFDEIEENRYEILKKRMMFCETSLDMDAIVNFIGEMESSEITKIAERYCLKLRDLSINFATKSYERVEYLNPTFTSRSPIDRVKKLHELIVKQMFDLFISFLAPPELVIKLCLPLDMTETIDKISPVYTAISKRKQPELPAKLINRWCLPYLTEIRRNLQKLQKVGPEGKIEWHYRSHKLRVGLEFFRINSDSNITLKDLMKIIDTALFELYVRYNRNLVGPLIRVNNDCDFDVVEKTLRENQMFQELIDYYYNMEEHGRALSLLTNLPGIVEGHQPVNGLDEKIQDLIIDYLRKLPNQFLDSIFQYTDWLSKNSTDIEFVITNIFMNDSPLCGTYNYKEVYRFIDKHSRALSLRYLEYIINIYHHTDTKLFNYLIMRYIENLDDNISVKKLKAILRTTSHYEPKVILRYLTVALESEDLSPEKDKLLKLLRTYPLRRLGEHDTALRILVEDLHNYSQSSLYCNEIYSSDKDAGVKVLMLLFKKLLSQVATHGWNNIHLFLLENGSKLDTLTLLEMLPNDIPIKSLSEFLSRRVKHASMKKNQSRIQSNLLRVNLIEQNYLATQVMSEFVIIGEDTKCYICHKNLNVGSSELFSLYKHDDSNIVTHYNCGRSLQGKIKPGANA